MNRTFDTATESSGPSLGLGDVYYTLFRHKWKILLLGCIGLGAAAVVYYTSPKLYRSSARLFIRYVQEEKALGTTDTVKTPGGRGDTTISSEIAILSALDVCQITADAIGPDKIVGDQKTDNARLTAAGIINAGLAIEVPRGSTVIEVAFSHTNPSIVKPVLTEVINTYLKRHLEIHRPGANFDDAFQAETDKLKLKLKQTETELLAAKKEAGIISLSNAKAVFADRINGLSNQILASEAQYAEQVALYNRVLEATGAIAKDTEAKDKEKQAADATQAAPDLSKLPVSEYQSLVERLNLVKKRHQDLLMTFTPESPRVQTVAAQVEELEKKKTALETEHPGLLRVAPVVVAGQKSSGPTIAFDPILEKARIDALGTRIEVLKVQREQARAEAAAVDAAELRIQDLERRKKLEEENYTFYNTSIEQARIREALGAGRVTNIQQVQTPTPAGRVAGNATKIAAGIGAGGFVLGIAWAFIIELFLDRTIRRPNDVRKHTGLNLFLSIPRVGKAKRLGGGRGLAAALPGPAGVAGESNAENAGTSAAMTPWSSTDELQPYYAALRDRLIGFFESEGITHKPKLIALAGVGKHAGDGAVAAGLAGSLSETEGGNVLFVDMTVGQGSAQQFFKGKAVGNIEDALISKEQSQVNEKLFVVSEAGKGAALPRALPMRFNHLIPKLKASDFDYIIFNMPPVSPISVTPRLASFMDMVLLVVESENTDRDLVTRARDLLSETKTPVGAVLNNTKSYVPHMLQQDFASLD